MTTRSTPVWDLPTRLTHWLFVVCLAFSWWTAEQRFMDWHRYSGYTMLGLLVFRIYWGIAGSSTVRFARFVGSPRAVLEHLRLRREERSTVWSPGRSRTSSASMRLARLRKRTSCRSMC
ncbi:MAG TPA: cytochrome b/b6 domain-containing protein [Steroidobacteraceae bacterium]|nr:cytochrome b/b6 domain-containing protein [Steroidobacteraceae bacterium]